MSDAGHPGTQREPRVWASLNEASTISAVDAGEIKVRLPQPSMADSSAERPSGELMNELNALLWSAGAERPPSETRSLDHDLLLRLIWQHRLVGRCLSRLLVEPQPWATAPFIAGLKALRGQNRYFVERQSQAVKEMAEAFRKNSDTPLVVIKGSSNQMLLADADKERWSSDIDVLSDRPEQFIDALVNHGYDFDSDASGHGLGYLRRGETTVELHRYYPVLDFRGVGPEADLVPSNHRGTWNIDLQITRHQIGYSDLVAHSVPVQANALRIPDANMAILISCAHVFRHSRVAIPSPVATVRLSELTEIRDLVMRPEFNSQTLLALAERFGGLDSIAFAGQLMAELLGSNPLPQLPAISAPGRYLWVFWVIPPWQPIDLLVRRTSINLGALIEYLGPNAVKPSAGADPWYTGLSLVGDRRLDRTITRNQKGESIRARLSVRLANESLVFDVSVLSAPGGQRERVCVDVVGSVGGECAWNIEPDTGKHWTTGPCGDVTSVISSDSYSVRFQFPLEQLRIRRADRVPAAVAVVRMGPGREWDPRAATLAPLMIDHASITDS